MLDSLEPFRPESDRPLDAQTGSHIVESITIAELLAGSVVIEWYEAVAVSQAICETLRLLSDDPRPVHLGPERVSINGSGRVHVSPKRRGDGKSALDEVAGLLKQMLGDQNIPTPLRLALSQTSNSKSLEEWSDAIAYYERPNRAELIQALYERAKTGASRPAAITAVVPAPVPLVSMSQPPEPTVPQTRRNVQPFQRIAFAVGIVIVVAVLVAAVVWFRQIPRNDAPTISKVADPSAETSSPVMSSATSVVESLVNRIPMLGLNERQLQPDTPPPPPAGRWIHLPSSMRPRVYESRLFPVTRSSPMSIPSVAPEEAGKSPVTSSAVRITDTIYSAADADVVPPVAVYPQFPSIPRGTDANDVAEFEVLVSAFGEVESVRARRDPASIGEALTMTMSLSAAKTWRFRPGLRNGEPVRYLQVISILKSR